MFLRQSTRERPKRSSFQTKMALNLPLRESSSKRSSPGRQALEPLPTSCPRGIRGDDISLGGQIVGLAEAWIALTGQRPYRSAMTKADAMGTLVGTAESWFSADLLKALRAYES